MSSTVITTDQQTLLSLGLSFAPMPREFRRLKLIDSLSYMSRAMFNDKPLETTTAQKQAWLQTPVIQKYVVMPPNPFIENNLERNQRAAINELRNNNDILILPADKGRRDGAATHTITNADHTMQVTIIQGGFANDAKRKLCEEQ
ncbi:hypothetical protein GJ496_011139 [Pomphorhynchus laevis]|nr:hypothetical protein GJ496_011139 [Pomphorhynchus laevis]